MVMLTTQHNSLCPPWPSYLDSLPVASIYWVWVGTAQCPGKRETRQGSTVKSPTMPAHSGYTGHTNGGKCGQKIYKGNS